MTDSSSDIAYIASTIAQEKMGGRVSGVQRLLGGVVNQVFDVALESGNVVVRMNQGGSVYPKENWAMKRATEACVNVPQVYAVGEHGDWSYILMEKIVGTLLPEYKKDRHAVVHKLGRMTRQVNDIAVPGFGFNLDLNTSPPVFTDSWEGMIGFEQEWIFGSDTLIQMNALPPQKVQRAKEFLEPMLAWTPQSRMCHGDLQPSNVMVSDDGAPFLLDWTLAKGGSPLFDVSRFYSTALEDINDFIAGYGWTQQDFDNNKADLDRVALNDVLRAAVWAYGEKHPELEKFAADVRVEFARIFGSGCCA